MLCAQNTEENKSISNSSLFERDSEHACAESISEIAL